MTNFVSEAVNFLKGKKEKTDWAEPIVMEKQLAVDYNTTRLPQNRHSFCFAPSSNMYFSQTGEVKVCCHNTEYTIGTYPQQTLHEIWNSKEANDLRKYMSRFNLSHGCDYCEFDMQLRSFDQVAAKHFDELPKQNGYPAMMEFLLTNTCNLECVMCKGEFSSLIRKNREKLPPIHNPYDKEFLKQLEEFIPHLRETRFSGSGEAFSIDLNYEIWEMIIRLNPNCLIMVQTNGTILTERVKNILIRGNFQIGVSVDSLHKETYESIRVNANFDKVKDNVKWFGNYCNSKKTAFRLALCVMRENWRELPAFINWCNDLNAMAVLHKVWYPKQYALNNLTASKLEEIYNYLLPVQLPEQNNLQKQNKRHYEYFVSVIKNWMENASVPEETDSIIESLRGDELLPYLYNKHKNYLKSKFGTEGEKEEALLQFTTKFEQLLSFFPDEQTREMITKHACTVPMVVMAESFEKYPVEYLFAEAGNLLKA
jgi:radical SAM protein with 4Fe4S-binding SPASM domain